MNKNKKMQIRLTQQQKEALQKLAEANTMTVSEFVRTFANPEIDLLKFLADLIRALNFSSEKIQEYDYEVMKSVISNLNDELERLQDNLCVLDTFAE